MEQYCIYLRKSRADLEAEGNGETETLARHERTLLELSKKLNLNIQAIYKEIVSGETISARPIMQKLLTEVEEGLWSGVLVMEIERLARGNTIDQGIVAQSFKFSNTKIITPMKTFDPNNEFDEEYFEFGLFMSRREYKTINRRLQRGRLASVKEGKYVANQPPYGYKRKKLENDKGYTLEQDENEAPIVQMIFNLYSLGDQNGDDTFSRLGTTLIANRLNSMKIPTRKGGQWSSSTIKDILTNPVYIGKIRWNWRPGAKKIIDGKIVLERPRNTEKCIITDGLHSPIVDKKIYELVQNLMARNLSKNQGSNKTIKNPLSGLVICGVCGRKMVRRPYTNGYPDTLMCPANTCDNVSSALYFVEERILESLKEWLEKYKINWNAENIETSLIQVEAKENIIKRLDKEIKIIKQQLSKIHDLLEQGVYTVDVFLERSKSLNNDINRLIENKKLLETEISSILSKRQNENTFMPKVEKLLDVYCALDTAKAKNDMLKEVLEKVVYKKYKNGRWHNSPEDFEIVLYPRIPNSYKKEPMNI